MAQDVFFKGLRGNLHLVINKDAEFAEVAVQLRKKLNASVSFFSPGTKVLIQEVASLFEDQQLLVIKNMLAEYGLEFVEFNAPIELTDNANRSGRLTTDIQLPQDRKPINWLSNEKHYHEGNLLTVRRMVRSGQRIVYDGSIMIYGDVNPGAEIIAGQDIAVFGVCRGLVHAGAFGERAAQIFAAKLLSHQVRIAGHIAGAPEQHDEQEYININLSLNEQNHITVQPIGKQLGRRNHG